MEYRYTISSILRRGAWLIFLLFLHTLLFSFWISHAWSHVSSLLPPGACLQFLSRIGSSNLTARRFFIECCQLKLRLIYTARGARSGSYTPPGVHAPAHVHRQGCTLRLIYTARGVYNCFCHRGVNSGRPGGVSGCPRAWYRSVS